MTKQIVMVFSQGHQMMNCQIIAFIPIQLIVIKHLKVSEQHLVLPQSIPHPFQNEQTLQVNSMTWKTGEIKRLKTILNCWQCMTVQDWCIKIQINKCSGFISICSLGRADNILILYES